MVKKCKYTIKRMKKCETSINICIWHYILVMIKGKKQNKILINFIFLRQLGGLLRKHYRPHVAHNCSKLYFQVSYS